MTRESDESKLESGLLFDENGKPKLNLDVDGCLVIIPSSSKEYDTFMQVLEVSGWKWMAGQLPTSLTNQYNLYKRRNSDVGINLNQEIPSLVEKRITCCNKKSYISNGHYLVISDQEFYESQKNPITQNDLLKINVWFDTFKYDRKSKS